VVIAILSLLMMLLVPSLQKARQLAQRVICLSNLRNIGNFTTLYVTDYDGYLWPVYNSHWGQFTTFHSLLGRLYVRDDYCALPTAVGPWNIEHRNGAGIYSSEIFLCPRRDYSQSLADLGQGAYSYTQSPTNPHARSEWNAEWSYGANWNRAGGGGGWACKRFGGSATDVSPWSKIEDWSPETFLLTEHVQEWNGPLIDDYTDDGSLNFGYPLDSYNATGGGQRPPQMARINWWRHEGASFLFIDSSAVTAKWGKLTRQARIP